MTEVFILRENEWMAIWQGQVARATFSSKGAALAWISVCDAKGRFHA